MLDLPVAGEKPWDVKLNAALNDLDSRLENTMGVPDAGTTGQILVKVSNDDYDAGWATLSSSGLIPDATTTTKGIVELATDAETITGTDTARATTPSNIAAALTAYNGLYAGVNAQTGTSYTPVLADVGKLVTLSNTGAITVTLPQDSDLAVPVGGRIDFAGINTGLVTFQAGSGATVNGTPSLVTRARYSAATAVKIAANTWLVVGDLA